MQRITRLTTALTLLAAVLCLPVAAGAVELDDGRGDVAKVFHGSTAIQFDPLFEAERWVLTLTGPCGPISQQFDPKAEIFFDIRSLEDDPDGLWTWELHRLPSVDPKVREALEASRGTGEEHAVLRSFRNKGLLPEGPLAQSGSFSVQQGVIIDPESGEEKTGAGEFPVTSAGTGTASSTPATPQAGEMVTKQVISGDLTVYNSLCVGFDCAASEAYGADTIRLKENNLRIHFDDTSTAGSFPSNDWRILVNDQANGGLARFSIEDTTANRIPFTIEAGASSNSIYADNGGRVGFGTSNPVVELHSRNGDTPALRLEQDTSSGFGAQVWDIAGNETSFFIRDATNGSTLPFRIRPGARSNSLAIDSDSEVGVGTLSPAADLHVLKTQSDVRVESNGSATSDHASLFLAQSGATTTSEFEIRANASTGSLEIKDSTAGGSALKFQQGAANNSLVVATNAGGFARVGVGTTSPQGNAGGHSLDVNGAIFQRGGVLHADYVFEPTYELLSIDENAEFMWDNKHLPSVPPRQVDAEGREVIELGAHRRGMLEELEKAHIYISQLNGQLKSKDARIEVLEERLTRLEELLTGSPAK